MIDPYTHIRSAFREVALGLMAWEEPPLMSPREYRRLELLETRTIYRPHDKQDGFEPFNVSADWEERA